jgi:hypothetical protein
MFCPYCGAFNDDGSAQCAACQGRFQISAPVEEAPVTEAPVAESPALKKGRIWLPIAILAAMLTVGLILFFTFPLTGSVATDPRMPWFTVEDGILYFDKALYTGGDTLTVPQQFGGQKVREISEYCFLGCDSFSAVRLPEGLEWIGPKAFAGCSELRGIKLPETLRGIGGEAFAGCTSLEAIVIPYTARTVGTGIFDDCDALRHIYYPGTRADWRLLKVDSIGPLTRVYCIDGVVSGT